MRRREFLVALSGAAVAVPFAAGAQQSGIRRVGVLLAAKADDSEYPTLIEAFVQRLRQAGWIDGRNLRLDIRWSDGNVDNIAKNAAELVALAPEVIMAAGSAATGPMLQATHNIPVVFTIVPDPVGAGFVDSLARPGGNATGFASFEYSIGGKWVDLLKEVYVQP